MGSPMVRIATDSTYDDVPYEGGIVLGTHPDRLGSMGKLFGIPVADPEHCSVLEIGCAAATNLLPMAYGLPNSTFVGIDPSERQIEMGRQFVADYGATNVELHALGAEAILDWDRKFDYIVCHGVFSWVNESAQEAILEACRRLLAPNGVAYISYNTLPGFYSRAAIREMLRFHASHFPSSQERAQQSRSLLKFLSDATQLSSMPTLSAHHSALEDEWDLLEGMPDSYLIHEHLTEHNQAFYFHEFVDLATAHELQYLGDAAFHTMMVNDLPADVARQIGEISSSQLLLEQYRDFVVNRMFRKTLLCHKDARLERQVSLGVLSSMQYRKRVAKNDDDEWVVGKTGGSYVQVSDVAVRSVLEALDRASPRSLAFDELSAEASALAGTAVHGEKLAGILLSLYALDAVDVRIWTPEVALEIDDRPEVFVPARRQPKDRRDMLPMPHHGFARPTPFLGAIVHLIDGTRTEAEIADAVAAEIADGSFALEPGDQYEPPTRDELTDMIPEALRQLLQVGLLVAK